MRASGWVSTAALLVLVVSVAPVSAAPATHTLTIQAPRSGYVDVRISRPLVFDLDKASLRGGRKYVGVVLDRLGSDSRPIELVHARFPEVAASSWRETTLGVDQEERSLPNGVYRLYALSDGAFSFRIRVTGLTRDIRVTTLTPSPARYRMVDIPRDLDPSVGSPYGGLRRLEFTSGLSDLPLARFGAVFAPGAVTSDGWDFCVSDSQDKCENAAGLDWTAVSWINDGSRADVFTYAPHDWLQPGKYNYTAKCRGLEKPVRCRAAVIDRYVSRAKSAGAIRL